jgi:putative transposase
VAAGKLSAALQEVIEGLALQRPPLPIRVVYNRARLAAQHLGEEPPNYDLVHDVVSHLPTDLVTLAHQGAKAYSNSFELVYRREAGCPNAIWQADHTPLDIELLQSELDPTRTAKPWLTAILDDYRRAVAGCFLGFFAYPRKKVQSRITPPKRSRFRSGFQLIPEDFVHVHRLWLFTEFVASV